MPQRIRAAALSVWMEGSWRSIRRQVCRQLDGATSGQWVPLISSESSIGLSMCLARVVRELSLRSTLPASCLSACTHRSCCRITLRLLARLVHFLQPYRHLEVSATTADGSTADAGSLRLRIDSSALSGNLVRLSSASEIILQSTFSFCDQFTERDQYSSAS